MPDALSSLAGTDARRFRRALLLRASTLAAVWWVLSGGEAASWLLGVPAVAIALWVSVRLAPPPALRFSAAGAVSYFGFFIWQSVKGGMQVAAMALRPTLDLRPALIDLQMRLPPGPSQLFLASTLSLMPGTLAVAVENNRLRLHVLDARLPIEREVRAAEKRIAAMYREALR